MLLLLVGFVLGLAVSLLFKKRKRNPDQALLELQKEFDDYKQSVSSHFDHSSTLFRDITKQYVDLYNHMSVGSTNLCDSQEPRLEQLEIKAKEQSKESDQQ